ncbi:unnamed protein product, partial [Allacma fusca]
EQSALKAAFLNTHGTPLHEQCKDGKLTLARYVHQAKNVVEGRCTRPSNAGKLMSSHRNVAEERQTCTQSEIGCIDFRDAAIHSLGFKSSR